MLKKDLIEQVKQLQVELANQLEINSRLTQSNGELKTELADAENTIADFNEELELKQKQVSLLSDQVKILNGSVTQLTKGNIVKGTFINELGTLISRLTESMTESEDGAFQNIQAINRLIK